MRHEGQRIKVHIYYHDPTGSGEPRVVLINWHVSGFIVPALGSDATFCSTVGKLTGIIVVDADYCKAPENPFPAAIKDSFDILQWIYGQPEKYGTNKLLLSGFSAGGNIALETSIARRRIQSRVKGVLAFYPVTNLHMPPEEKKASALTQPLLPFVPNFIATYYIPSSGRKDDPRVSPTLSSLVTFPSNLF